MKRGRVIGLISISALIIISIIAGNSWADWNPVPSLENLLKYEENNNSFRKVNDLGMPTFPTQGEIETIQYSVGGEDDATDMKEDETLVIDDGGMNVYIKVTQVNDPDSGIVEVEAYKGVKATFNKATKVIDYASYPNVIGELSSKDEGYYSAINDMTDALKGKYEIYQVMGADESDAGKQLAEVIKQLENYIVESLNGISMDIEKVANVLTSFSLKQGGVERAAAFLEVMDSGKAAEIIASDWLSVSVAAAILNEVNSDKIVDILCRSSFLNTPWHDGRMKAADILSSMDIEKAANVLTSFSLRQGGVERAATFLEVMDAVTKEKITIEIVENIKPLAVSYDPLNAAILSGQLSLVSSFMSENISVEVKTKIATELMASFDTFYNEWQAYVEASDVDHADSYNDGSGGIVNTLIGILKEQALDSEVDIDMKHFILDYLLETFTSENFIPHYQLMICANALEELEQEPSLAEYIGQKREETLSALCRGGGGEVNSISAYLALRIAYLVGEDEGLKSIVAESLNISGKALAIWNDFGVIVINELGVREAELTITWNTLAVLPEWIISPTKALVFTRDFPELWRAAEAWGGFIKLKKIKQYSRVLTHEMGHEVDFIGRYNPDIPFPTDFDFEDFYDASGDNIENFAMEYGMTNHFEDFATIFSWYVEDTLDILSLTKQRAEDGDPTNDVFVAKIEYMTQLFSFQGEDGKMYTHIFHFSGNGTRELSKVEMGNDGLPLIPDDLNNIQWEVFDEGAGWWFF